MSLFEILVIEDDEVDQINISRALKSNNIINKTHFAADGVEGMEKLNFLKQPVLILLDINMPRMNGIEFLTKLRQMPEWCLTPVIILTTSKEERDLVAAYKLGVVGYVVKPIDIGEFVRAIALLGQYWTICEFPR